MIGGPQGRHRAHRTQNYCGYLWWHGSAWRWLLFVKDPSKVDRSGAYMARYVAKNRSGGRGLAERCELQVAYVIGRAEPTSININTFGTGN